MGLDERTIYLIYLSFPVVIVRALIEYFAMIIMHAIMMLSTFLVWSSDEEKNVKQ